MPRHNGSLIPPDRELLMDRFLSHPSQLSLRSLLPSVFPLTPTPLWDFLRPACCSVPGPPVSLCHQSCPRRTTYWGSCNTALQSTAPWDNLGLLGCPERLWGLLLGDLLWMSLPSPTALGFPSRVRAGVRLFWALGRFKPGPTALLQGVCSTRHRTGAVSQ